MMREFTGTVFGLFFVMVVCFTSMGFGQTAEELWREIGRHSATDGGITDDTQVSLFPDVIVGSDRNPVICWMNDDAAFRLQIYVKRWNGSSWVEFGEGSAAGGGISNNSSDSTHPVLVTDPAGNPIVCWRDEGKDREGRRLVRGQIYVRRWDGSSWVEMGESSASGTGISSNTGYSSAPSMARGTEGSVFVCWAEMVGESGQLHVARWDGRAWRKMPKLLVRVRNMDDRGVWSVVKPRITVGSGGHPIVCWSDYGNRNWEVYVKHWDGSVWAELGEGSASGGGISRTGGRSSEPRIAVDAAGRALVCWTERIDTREVYIKRWDGSAWVEMGRHSASAGGISNDAANSMHPDLAIAPDSFPVICWTSGEIYVRRWNGSGWIEMGTGSASGKGISNNKETSGSPAMTIGIDGNPIVAFWNGTAEGDREIYVRRYVPSSRQRVREQVEPGASAEGEPSAPARGVSPKI